MDKALKQRLVGASVLILLAVIVLPMLLSGQPGPQQDTRRIEVPPKPAELSFETRRFPIGDQEGEGPSVVEPAVQAGTGSPPEEAVTVQNADQAPAAGSADPGTPTGESAAPEPAGQRRAEPGRYLVQVASFSTTANANRLAGRLREDGLPVLMDIVETNAGRLHRVRVGPFDQEAGANAAVAELRAAMPDLNPRVLDLRPDESAPVTEPDDPLVRWVVQAGSFSAAENAENLLNTLRAGGYTAYSAAVTDESGTVFKVRIGPVIDRQSALELADQLQRDTGMEGLVMSVD